MHKIENKSLWKEEMSYGGDTWYMGRTKKINKKKVVVKVVDFPDFHI